MWGFVKVLVMIMANAYRHLPSYEGHTSKTIPVLGFFNLKHCHLLSCFRMMNLPILLRPASIQSPQTAAWKTEQFPQPISTYIDIPTFFFWHDHRRTFNGLDLDFWNDSCNANNIFFWKSKSWFASLPPHNRLWWQKWALWKSLLLLMMVVMAIMMILSGLCRQESQLFEEFE